MSKNNNSKSRRTKCSSITTFVTNQRKEGRNKLLYFSNAIWHGSGGFKWQRGLSVWKLGLHFRCLFRFFAIKDTTMYFKKDDLVTRPNSHSFRSASLQNQIRYDTYLIRQSTFLPSLWLKKNLFMMIWIISFIKWITYCIFANAIS